MVKPSLRLLRSLTVNGVMRCVRITPLMMPIPSQKIEMMVKKNTRRLDRDASTKVAYRISALYKKTNGLCTIKVSPPKIPAVGNLPSVSISRFSSSAQTAA